MPSQLAPERVTDSVLELCRRLCPQQIPFYVTVSVESWAIPFDRFGNVHKKVSTCGGALVPGWSIYELPRLYLEARFHAIWQSPAGTLSDIAPEECTHSKTLFLPDMQRHPNGAPLPPERLALVEDPLLPAFWEAADDVRACLEKHRLSGLDVRHPVVCQELRPLVTQLQSLSRLLGAS